MELWNKGQGCSSVCVFFIQQILYVKYVLSAKDGYRLQQTIQSVSIEQRTQRVPKNIISIFFSKLEGGEFSRKMKWCRVVRGPGGEAWSGIHLIAQVASEQRLKGVKGVNIVDT